MSQSQRTIGSSVPSPVAPFTGKIELPFDALQSLARAVVGDLHTHILQSISAENADEVETWETDPDNAMDTQMLLSHVDPLRWKRVVEQNGADPRDWSQESLQAFNDNDLVAQTLLNLGETKAQGVSKCYCLGILLLIECRSQWSEHVLCEKRHAV